jgi:hypothetical protein
VEPYISPLSKLVYDNFHPEPVCLDCDPLKIGTPLSFGRPFDSNQAVSTLIFFRRLQGWHRRFPEFTLVKRKRFAIFAYQATGRFNGKKLLPEEVIPILNRIERFFDPLAGFLAFRTIVVLPKISENRLFTR